MCVRACVKGMDCRLLGFVADAVVGTAKVC